VTARRTGVELLPTSTAVGALAGRSFEELLAGQPAGRRARLREALASEVEAGRVRCDCGLYWIVREAFDPTVFSALIAITNVKLEEAAGRPEEREELPPE
jgi:hypothetical protein